MDTVYMGTRVVTDSGRTGTASNIMDANGQAISETRDPDDVVTVVFDNGFTGSIHAERLSRADSDAYDDGPFTAGDRVRARRDIRDGSTQFTVAPAGTVGVVLDPADAGDAYGYGVPVMFDGGNRIARAYPGELMDA